MKWVRCQVPDRVAKSARVLSIREEVPVSEVYAACIVKALDTVPTGAATEDILQAVRKLHSLLGTDEDNGKGVISTTS